MSKVKKNKKRFCRYIAQKRQAKEIVSLPINEKGQLASTDTNKAEWFSFLLSSLALRLPTPHAPEPPDWGSEEQNASQ